MKIQESFLLQKLFSRVLFFLKKHLGFTSALLEEFLCRLVLLLSQPVEREASRGASPHMAVASLC